MHQRGSHADPRGAFASVQQTGHALLHLIENHQGLSTQQHANAAEQLEAAGLEKCIRRIRRLPFRQHGERVRILAVDDQATASASGRGPHPIDHLVNRAENLRALMRLCAKADLGDDHVRRVGFRDAVLCNSPAVFDDGAASADRAPSWFAPQGTRGLPHEYRDMPRISGHNVPVTARPSAISLASFL